MNTRKSIILNNQKIFYRTWGTGSYPLFALPGWPASSLCFSLIGKYLQNEFTLIALDYPGWAGTPTLKSGKTDIQSVIPIVQNFITSFNFRKYSVLGYSFGGLVLQTLLKTKQIKPEKIILTSTFHDIQYHIKKPFYRNFFKIINKTDQISGNSNTLKKMIFSYFKSIDVKIGYYRSVNPKEFLTIIKETEKASTRNILESLKSIAELDIGLLDLREYDPLVIYADGDLPLVIEDSRKFANANNFKQVIISKSSHSHILFQPEENFKLIVKHLAL
ncbi:MAG: alpha/beta hydrolase [bacterium]